MKLSGSGVLSHCQEVDDTRRLTCTVFPDAPLHLSAAMHDVSVEAHH